MAKLLYEIEIDKKVQLMTNDELLTETLNAAGGDGWDGMFTQKGEYEFKAFQSELERRLKGYGFLTKA